MKSIKSALITTLLLIGGSANAAFINFSDYTATAYGNQSKTGLEVVSNSGNTFTLNGNRWVDILYGVTLTSTSILNFSVEATGLNAELYGIAFETNDTYKYGQMDNFVFFGGTQLTQVTSENSLPSFGSYSSGDGVVNFSINVGDYFTGVFDRMVFILDNDANQSGSVVSFSNVEVCDNALVCQQSSVIAVPEPAHIGLASLALIVMGVTRRRKKI